MSKEKSKFGQWLGTAVTKVPGLINAASMVMTGNVVGAFNEVKNVLSNDPSPEAQALSAEFRLQEMAFEKEVFALEIEDRKSARELYKSDDIMQKVFAGAFLAAYIALSYYLVNILIGNTAIPDLAETMITMIWTGTSTKLGTIVDFFFGGSVKQPS